MIELPLITIHLSNYILKNIKALLRQFYIFYDPLHTYRSNHVFEYLVI